LENPSRDRFLIVEITSRETDGIIAIDVWKEFGYYFLERKVALFYPTTIPMRNLATWTEGTKQIVN
jgi:hypothetical protein